MKNIARQLDDFRLNEKDRLKSKLVLKKALANDSHEIYYTTGVGNTFRL